MTRWLVCAALACSVAGCGTTFDLGSNDAGVPYDADCKPGTYTGNFSCMSTSTSTLFPSMPGAGPITVTLVPAGAHTLALPPDAVLSNNFSGIASTEALMGVLDCPNRKLSGMTGNVVFRSSTFNGTLTGSGTFDAVYNADASPPELDNGTLSPPSVFATTCTWSAKLE
jgi:hypothetical protein